MAIAFRRTPLVQTTKYNVPKEGLVYPGLIINVVGENGLTLGSDAGLIRYEDGTYKPYLQKVNVKVEGELGLLLRAEFTFSIDKDSDFVTYSNAFLAPNKSVTINYGWSRPHPGYEGNRKGEWKDLLIYDFSWEFDSSAQRYTCTAKAMGQAGTIEDCEFAISISNGDPKNPKNPPLFITKENGAAGSRQYPVKSIIDLIVYESQIDKNTNTAAQVQTDAVVKASGKGHIVTVLMFETNWLFRLIHKLTNGLFGAPSKSPKVYVTLNYLIHNVLNDRIIPYHYQARAYTSTTGGVTPPPRYELANATSIEGVELLFSPDPGTIAFTGGKAGDYLTEDGQYGVDFNTAVNKDGYEACIQGNKLILGNILISLDALRAIDKEIEKARDEKQKATKTDESSKADIVMPIKDFIAKISALINNNSGGLIDLTTYQDEDGLVNGTPIINIIDRNYKGEASATPLEFNNRFPGDGVTLSATITSEVPKDAVSMNAYATNIKGTAARKLSQTALKAEIERSVRYKFAADSLEKIRTDELPSSEFDEDAVQAATRAIRNYVQNRPIQSIVNNNNTPYPLKLKLQLAGVEGFRFGDLITLKGLPPVYRDEVCFRVLRYTHTFEGNKWITDIESVCDLK